MRVIVAGMGVQGAKRLSAAGADAVATIDPVKDAVDFRDVRDVPLTDYDAALLCIPDEAKIELLDYLLAAGKHVLVEKPVLSVDDDDLIRLAALAEKTGAACYTAYNHRFEPHFVRMADLIKSGRLGKIYSLRMFYGNGTARLVRDSAWRDQGAGVLPDLGSHLLDTLRFWLGQDFDARFRVRGAYRHENRSFDHVVIDTADGLAIQLEMTMLSWRNHHTTDIFAEHGSAHIESLCKWGPSTFTHRTRVLPSGRPPEEAVTLVQADPTWDLEYAHFKKLCAEAPGTNGLANDLWINRTLRDLAAQAGVHDMVREGAGA
ncbi:Gfo/Idh/MocA family oxidoreductase [Thalassospiraceae bacterium LMO-SO8]|nr:Gfo/Idh/MocA family oxidoreductase [Alphaproteobacteria bacterium LMO-S08]WND77658.1 Gfo/Idh/MocA family oxidoreductase [Thalassospiraceae bacterium LMO-SO8]